MGWTGVKTDLPERTFKFAIRVMKVCRHVEKQTGVTRRLAGQLFDSATSIGANVEEAQGAQSRKDFIHKNNIAMKEARETTYWLRLLIASGCVGEERVDALLAESREIASILGKVVVTARNNLESEVTPKI